ncbi:MAG: DUF1573 domain-containing protein [Kiritimatiellae bacterium]|nr:DUF1573 domain-containing protein [Kiritimatiellia bacterium]
MKRTGVIFFLFFATVAVVTAAGRLEIVGPDTVDVGAFEPGERPSAVFRFKNAGDAPLRFTHVVSTCRCLELVTVPGQLPPGKSAELVARVRQEQADEAFSSTVLIETDSPETPYTHVTVKRASPWNRTSLYRPPEILQDAMTNGLQLLSLRTPHDGKPAYLPAFMGFPKRNKGEVSPGIVLGGEGCLDDFIRRIQFWNARGFAAIAVDLAHRDDRRPVSRQAVEGVVRAHSFLRAQPGVDTNRIGVAGIARGGYAVCLAAAVDERFAFAISIDAGRFLGDGGTAPDKGGEADPLRSAPALQLVRMPFLWMDSTASPLPLLQDHYRRAKTPQTLCIRYRDANTPWQPGEDREEPVVFARHAVRDGTSGLPSFGAALRRGRRIAAPFAANGNRVAKAVLVAAGNVEGGTPRWRAYPAELREHHVEATLPEGTSAYYLNLSTEEGLVVSSRHETCTL